MNSIFHADDFGLTKGITESILDTFINGKLQRTSIVPNGYAFEYAVELLRKNSNLKYSIHVNLAEGPPVSDPIHVDLLTDKSSMFNRSFIYFLYYSVIGNRKLKEQIKTELRSQINLIIDRLGIHDEIIVDSHNHYHMLKIILDSLIEIRTETKWHKIRFVREPFFLSSSLWQSVKNIFSLNLIKHVVVNILSVPVKRKLDGLGIPYNDATIGILYSGNMGQNVIAGFFNRVNQKYNEVEFIFHPGKATMSEGNIWILNRRMKDFYTHNNRTMEGNFLKTK